MSEANPFFTDIPIVLVVVAAREVSAGVTVESSMNSAHRVWGRVCKTTRADADADIFPSETGRLFPTDKAGTISPF